MSTRRILWKLRWLALRSPLLLLVQLAGTVLRGELLGL